MLRKAPVALALGVAWGLFPETLRAQAPAPSPVLTGDTTPLDEITVTSTRTPRKTDNVPDTVTVQTATTIEESGARDLKDVFRDEVDVTVPSGPTRFTAANTSTGRAGNEGINIRGLEGNQVLMLIDGIRVANAFSFGSFATGRGDFFDISGAQTIEVLRGPASTQYGSDGLAGAVSFRTPEPADLIRPGRAAGGSVRLGYNQVDRSWNSTLATAGRTGDWQGLLLGTVRRGHALANRGDDDAPNITRTAPNPVDATSHHVLGKLLFDLNRENRLGLTVEDQVHRQETEVLSARAVPPLVPSSVLDLVAHDKVTRDRISVEHRYTDLNALWLQRASTQVYGQTSEVGQVAAEDRNTLADRTRDNTYRQKVAGLSTQFETYLASDAVNHHLTYGIDWSRTKVTGERGGTVPPMGENFPTKPFPDTAYTLFGAFAQDEMEAGPLSAIPGLRFDKYQLAPSSGGYSGGAVTALSDQAVTPRIGVVWRLAGFFMPYGQYAKGFRAPTPDQVNNGFTNVASGYRSVGNPDLQPERADSIEVGVRGKPAQGVRYSIAAYANRYKDFISQQVVGGSGAPTDPLVFQYINLAKARIHGAEARGDWQVDRAWNLSGGIGWSRGESVSAGVESPLDTIQPWKTVFGLRYDVPTWGARATVLHSAGKHADRIAPTAAAPFAPGGYTTLDLGATWKPRPDVTISANLNNVFDATYWRWSDVRGLADTSPVKDAYTAPGRNLQIGLRVDF